MNTSNISTDNFQRKVIMFHVGRCGSVVLATLLKQNPDITWGHELFRPDWIPKRFERYATRDPVELLQMIMREMKSGKPMSTCFGFETQLPQIQLLELDLNAYLKQLQNEGFKYVLVLKRRNFLRKLISAISGNQTSIWHLKTEETAVLTRFRIDPNNILHRGEIKPLIDCLEYEHKQYGILEEISKITDTLQLTYEDDVLPDPLIGYRRVCEYLDIEPVKVSIQFGKTNPFKLSQMIINFDEIVATLRGTQYEWMIYE